jgi:TolB protein
MRFRFYFLLAIILFAINTSMIHSAGQSTSAPATPSAQVTVTPQAAQNPAGVEKQFKIAFISYRDKKPALYIMNEDGSNQTRIVKDPVVDYTPIWSPDGTRILYLKNNGKKTEIWSVQADGNNPIRLSDDCFCSETALQTKLSWSPDGTKVLFTSKREEDRMGIYMVEADGTKEFRLTDVETIGSFPSWSPDGSKILCRIKTNDETGIYRLNLDGTVDTKFLQDKGVYASPIWSPDGKKIAYRYQKPFTLLKGISKTGLFVMNSDGGNPTQLAEDAEWFKWSPDCKSIIYTALIKTGIDERVQSNLLLNFLTPTDSKGKKEKKITSIIGTYMVNVLEGKPVLLVDSESSRFVPYDIDQNRLNLECKTLEQEATRIHPNWSADSSAIAFIYSNLNSKPLFATEVVGTNLIIHLFNDGKTNTVKLPYPCNEQPVWSPDGSKIAYINFTGIFSKSSIFILDGSGKITRITNNTYDIKPAWSPVALP